ncbi:MAG: amidohydrolase family protein [Bacteroidota bacterium]
MIIDAHQHFWQYNAQKHAWINDEMKVLKRDFLPADLQSIYRENGIDGCVAVQADQSEAETDFLLGLAEKYEFIKGVVGWVDLRSPNVESRLAYYAQFSKLKGFRHIVQNEPDPNFMLGDAFQRGLSLSAEYNFTYDILIFPTQLSAAIETVSRFPNQAFILNHIAKPNIKNRVPDQQWKQQIEQLATHPNVYCKFSGMVTEAHWQQWKYDDFVPYLDVIFAAFGENRLLFGSDWPVCLLAADYAETKQIVAQYLSTKTKSAHAKVFGQNAVQFYSL